jgi:hypothetical protein
VLPELAEKGYRVQFAFIDGAHSFDLALIDFFYLDQMMENGGVIVFDDVSWQSVNAVVRFVLANRDYELVEVLELSERPAWDNRGKRLVKRMLRRLARTDKDPAEEHQHLFRQLEFAHSVALRKIHPYLRRLENFYHYAF